MGLTGLFWPEIEAYPIPMHAGGVLHDSMVSSQTARSLRDTFAAKASPWRVHDAGAHSMPLVMQVLFSSTAALLGSRGQSNHSTANAALDAAAMDHSARGGVCTRVCSGEAQKEMTCLRFAGA